MGSINTLKPVLRLPHRPCGIMSSTSFSTSSRCLSQASNRRDTPLTTLSNNLTMSMRNAMPSYLEEKSSAGFPQEPQPWHLHCYSTKHNTHMTLSRPNRDAVISVSTGQIGFKKAQRGSYDAAYQLGAYLMARIQRAGVAPQIDQLELVFRGFGVGRDAFTKIMTGTEGSLLRNKVVQLTDATRLKFGGTRSKKPRRLG